MLRFLQPKSSIKNYSAIPSSFLCRIVLPPIVGYTEAQALFVAQKNTLLGNILRSIASPPNPETPLYSSYGLREPHEAPVRKMISSQKKMCDIDGASRRVTFTPHFHSSEHSHEHESSFVTAEPSPLS